ncbi:MAG: hypothetical protein PHY29_02890 [Syntrophales bacterium]|nr:hypothetical protein [Syntrophales bacterium]
MKVWITKYALTDGIVECEVEAPSHDCPKMIVVKASSPGTYNQYFYKPDWHTTREEAVKRANVMKDKKLVSLRNQIEKIKELKFE